MRSISYRSAVSLIAAAIVTAGPPAPAMAQAGRIATSPAPDLQAARAYVDAYYRGVVSDAPTRPRVTFDNARYAPELKALLDQANREAGGEVGILDWDPFCECQDHGPNARFTSSVEATGTGKAVVTVLLREGRTGLRTFRIDLAVIGGRWHIADVHGPQTPSLVAWLRRNLKHPPRAPSPRRR